MIEDKHFEILNSLNEQQRKAVEQTDRPVMVIAGPGTGKTQLVAARVLYLLTQTDSTPQSILCLTFTDAGVTSLKKRLRKLLGTTAHLVTVSTFHSFCGKVIRENPAIFAQAESLPLDDIAKADIMSDVLKLHPEVARQYGRFNPESMTSTLSDLFKTMKSELWEYEHIKMAAEFEIESLPHNPNYQYQQNRKPNKKGDPKLSEIKKQTDRLNRTVALASMYDTYQDLLKKRGYFEYADMIRLVIDAFSSNEWLLRRYQEQYLDIIVDEYQDTNGSQNKIVKHLIEYWDTPSILVVGDDDQAIYEFQGARLENLEEFYRSYEDSMQVITLETNYRSSQTILDASHTLIGHNELRLLNRLNHLNLTKDLTAAGPSATYTNGVSLAAYKNGLEQAVSISAFIKQLISRGAKPQEIAVIYRNHDHVEELVDTLQRLELPFVVNRAPNAFDSECVKHLISLLQLIEQETRLPYSAEGHLSNWLMMPWSPVETQDVARLSYSIFQNRQWPTWRHALEADLSQESLQLDQTAFQEASRQLQLWISHSLTSTVHQLAELLLNSSGLLRYTLDHPNAAQELTSIKVFMDFIQERIKQVETQSLASILDLIRLMNVTKTTLPTAAFQDMQRGIFLTTAHGSKGLEFDHVIIYDISDTAWTNTNSKRYTLPEQLVPHEGLNEIESNRRLFYVALTRARKNVFMTYSSTRVKGNKLKEELPCQFVQELQAGNHISEYIAADIEVNLREAMLLSLQPKKEQHLISLDTSFIQSIVDDYVLSATGLEAYLQCPLKFFFLHVLKIPETKDSYRLYGTAIHATIERLFDLRKRHPQKQLLTQDALLEIYEYELSRYRYSLKKNEFDHLLENGRSALSNWYTARRRDLPQESFTEVHIQTVEYEGIKMKGTIDRIDEVNDGYIQVVDYKTSTGIVTNAVKSPPKNPLSKNAKGWRQLVFYKLLYQHFRPGTIVKKGIIDTVSTEPENPMLELELGPEDSALLLPILQNTWSSIQKLYFEGCKEKNCKWCRFAEQGKIDMSLFSPEAAEIDDFS